MTDKERIERLESIIKSLNRTIQNLVEVVNTGSYESHLDDIEMELTDVSFFEKTNKRS